MLIDVVGVDKWLVKVVSEQALGQLRDDLLGMAADSQAFKRRGALLPPDGEMGVHAGDEGGELGVAVDGGLDGGLVHRKAKVTPALFPEQGMPELRTDIPVALERIDVSLGDAAPQVPRDVLQVFGGLAVNIARRMSPSALPRNSTPWGRMQAPFPVFFRERTMCSR